MKLPTRRKEQIVQCYVLATRGRLPEDLDQLLGAMRQSIGELTESEVRAAIAWSLRRSKRLERRLRQNMRCAYAKSDMTPCVRRDGAVCFALDGRDQPICVGCERTPEELGVLPPAD
jgi:hypothetical protein